MYINLRQKVLYNIKTISFVFGSDWVLFMENDNKVYCNSSCIYQPFPNHYEYQLLGGEHGESIKEIEVFQLQ